MQVFNPSITTTRYELEAAVRKFAADSKLCARPASHAQLDKYKMDGNPGAFLAREFSAKGVLLEKGRDLFCGKTNTLLEWNDIKKAREAAAREILGDKTVFLFIDPEDFAKNEKGVYVIVNPKITLVENAVLEYGAAGRADPATKIAISVPKGDFESVPDEERRWNTISDGINYLVRGKFGKRHITGIRLKPDLFLALASID